MAAVKDPGQKLFARHREGREAQLSHDIVLSEDPSLCPLHPEHHDGQDIHSEQNEHKDPNKWWSCTIPGQILKEIARDDDPHDGKRHQAAQERLPHLWLACTKLLPVDLFKDGAEERGAHGESKEGHQCVNVCHSCNLCHHGMHNAGWIPNIWIENK